MNEVPTMCRAWQIDSHGLELYFGAGEDHCDLRVKKGKSIPPLPAFGPVRSLK
jgi:hypothetical protein